jgi:phosphoglycerate dehydrogenase-like enzyme
MRNADSAAPVRIVVAGVPRSYQQPHPDGRWLTSAHTARIEAVSPRVELLHTTRAELAAGHVPDPPAELLLVEASGAKPYLDEIPAEALRALVTPRLRWLQSCSSGVGHILNLGLLDERVLLTNAAGVHANALAESVMAGILWHAKRLRARDELQRQQVWQELRCVELRGSTLVVLGTGQIGAAVARLAGAFGLRVVGVRRTPRPTPGCDEVVGPERLHSALAQADYVVIACPLTAETEGMLGPAEFAALRPGAFLLNVSRGKVVQEAALLAALANGPLAGAYLDAHAQEPLPSTHPLWELPNVLVIPHDSHSSPLIGDNIVELFCDNLRRYLAGAPLRNLVDRARGY